MKTYRKPTIFSEDGRILKKRNSAAFPIIGAVMSGAMIVGKVVVKGDDKGTRGLSPLEKVLP